METSVSSNEIKGKVVSPMKLDRTLTQAYMCAEAKAVGDALAQKVSNAVEIINLRPHTNITSTKGVCYKQGNVCTVVFDFITKEDIPSQGVLIYADLPKPKDNFTFEVTSMFTEARHWIGVFPSEGSGLISTAYVKDIPSSTRLFGTFTYVSE